MKAIRDVAYYLSAMVVSKGFGILQSFVLARILGPDDFGVWVTLVLLVSYGPIFALGSLETLIKQVPFFNGRNDQQNVREVENGVLGSTVLSAVFACLLAVSAPVVIPLASWKLPPFLAVIVFLTIAIGCFSGYFYYRFVAHEDFKRSGLMDALRSVLALVFIGGLGWAWGVRGAAVGYLLHELGMCLIMTSMNVRAHGKVGVSFSPGLLVRIIKIGFPITILWWVFMLTFGLDRIVLGKFLGAVSVGYYGLGISLIGTLGLVPLVVGRVLYPKVNKQFGKEADPSEMKRLVVAPTLALGALMANLQLALVLGAPFLYNVLLPKYHLGLMAGQILILGTFFGSLLRNGANYLIATNQERPFLLFIVATLIFNLVADVTLVKSGYGIEGVAVGTSLAGFLLNTLVWRRVFERLGFTSRQVWTNMLGLNLPIFLLIGMVACARLFYSAAFQNFDVTSTGIALAIGLLMNGAFYAVPMYRVEMLAWKGRLSMVADSAGQWFRLSAKEGARSG